MGQTLQKMAKIKLEMGKITDLNCSGMGWLMLFMRLMLKENPMYVNHNKQVECVWLKISLVTDIQLIPLPAPWLWQVPGQGGVAGPVQGSNGG